MLDDRALNSVELHLTKGAGDTKVVCSCFFGVHQFLCRQVHGEVVVHPRHRRAAAFELGQPGNRIGAGKGHQLIEFLRLKRVVKPGDFRWPQDVAAIVGGNLQVPKSPFESRPKLRDANVIMENLQDMLGRGFTLAVQPFFSEGCVDSSPRAVSSFRMWLMYLRFP